MWMPMCLILWSTAPLSHQAGIGDTLLVDLVQLRYENLSERFGLSVQKTTNDDEENEEDDGDIDESEMETNIS
jgi:hypothetical protein